MKTVIKGICMFVIVLFFILMMLAITNKSNRQYELDSSLNSAIMQTMQVLHDERYEISSNEELLSELHRNLLLQINSNSAIEVFVYGIDIDKGLLDVGVESKFTYTDGRNGSVYSRKTVVIDKI